MNYIKNIPETPSFSQNGMDGYSFNINNKNISIDIIESYKYQIIQNLCICRKNENAFNNESCI